MRHELLRADADAFVLEGLEAGQLGLDGVDAGRNGREVVLALLVGDRVARGAVGFVDQRDGHAGHDAAGVAHDSAHATGKRLRPRGTGD